MQSNPVLLERRPMKIYPLFVRLVVTLLVCAGSAMLHAAPKKHKKHASAEAQETPNAATAITPSQMLSPYIEHVDVLLALDRSGGPKVTAFCDEAAGKLAVLKQDLAQQRSTAAPANQASFAAAMGVCDRIAAALDERQKTLGQIQASSAVSTSGKLGLHSKTNPHYADLIREHAEQANQQRLASDDSNAIQSASVRRWNDRTVELRKQITDAYTHIPPLAPPAPTPAAAQPAAQ